MGLWVHGYTAVTNENRNCTKYWEVLEVNHSTWKAAAKGEKKAQLLIHFIWPPKFRIMDCMSTVSHHGCFFYLDHHIVYCEEDFQFHSCNLKLICNLKKVALKYGWEICLQSNLMIFLMKFYQFVSDNVSLACCFGVISVLTWYHCQFGWFTNIGIHW